MGAAVPKGAVGDVFADSREIGWGLEELSREVMSSEYPAQMKYLFHPSAAVFPVPSDTLYASKR